MRATSGKYLIRMSPFAYDVLYGFGETFAVNKVLILMFTQDVILGLMHEPSKVLTLNVIQGSHKG